MSDDQVWGSLIEGTSGQVKFTIEDQDGNGVQPTTLSFSLFNKKTETVLNSRLNVSMSPVATYVSAAGVLTFDLTAADNVFYNPQLRSELHVLKFTATWSSGTKTAKFPVFFYLERDREPST